MKGTFSHLGKFFPRSLFSSLVLAGWGMERRRRQERDGEKERKRERIED